MDVRRLRVRQAWQMGVVEQRSLPSEEGQSPSEESWRYRRAGCPRAFAVFGVLVGFVLLIVPGLVALHSYRRWLDGLAQPTFAWSMAVVGLLAVPLGLLFTVLPIVAVGLGVLVGLPLLVLVGPRH